jgi:hypothetical protein
VTRPPAIENPLASAGGEDNFAIKHCACCLQHWETALAFFPGFSAMGAENPGS